MPREWPWQVLRASEYLTPAMGFRIEESFRYNFLVVGISGIRRILP